MLQKRTLVDAKGASNNLGASALEEDQVFALATQI
jgi:hypothetical protein